MGIYDVQDRNERLPSEFGTNPFGSMHPDYTRNGRKGSPAAGLLTQGAVSMATKPLEKALLKKIGSGILGKVIAPMAAPLPGMAGTLLATALLSKLFGKKPSKMSASQMRSEMSAFDPNVFVPENMSTFRQENMRNYGR